MVDQTVLWPLRVNWAGGWDEKYSFNTDIFRSEAGYEQRRALRDDPRVRYSFTSLTGGAPRNAALSRLAARQGGEFVIPYGREAAVLASPITAGGTAFSLVSLPDWWSPGQDLILIRGDRVSERVQAVNATTLTEPAENSWPVGTRVHLGVSARFAGRSEARFPTSRVLFGASDFEAKTGVYLPDTSAIVPSQFGGRDLFLLRPNWSDPVTIDFEQLRARVDFGFGVWNYYTRNDFVDRTLKTTYLLRDETEFKTLLHRFLASKGKRGSFYMPSWISELEPVYVTATAIGIKGTELATMMTGDLVHRKVFVRGRNGTDGMANVTSITNDGANTILTVDADLSGIPVAWISWLLRWRFFSDDLEVRWRTDGLGEATVTLFSLEDAA